MNANQKLLTDSKNETNVVVRDLCDGPNYSPDWRHLVAQSQLLLARQSDQSEVQKILSQETDNYLRALIEFHSGIATEFQTDIEYAIRCNHDRATTRVAGAIKAMVIADRTAEQIAKLIGTSPEKVTAFEKIFFDVRRYSENRVWLKAICFPPLDQYAPAYLQAEVRLMQIAFNRGWDGLYPHFCARTSQSAKPDPHRLMQLLIARAADYVDELELRGSRLNDRDLQRLLLAQQAMASAKIPIAAQDLAYEKALDPEEEKELEELRQKAERLPLSVRRNLGESLRRHLAAIEQGARDITAQQEEESKRSAGSDEAASAGTGAVARADILPTATVGAATPQIRAGEIAAWTIFLSTAVPSTITVKYSLSGNFSGDQVEEITIPAGSNSVSVTKNFSTTRIGAQSEEVMLLLERGNGYQVGAPYNATITITG